MWQPLYRWKLQYRYTEVFHIKFKVFNVLKLSKNRFSSHYPGKERQQAGWKGRWGWAPPAGMPTYKWACSVLWLHSSPGRTFWYFWVLCQTLISACITSFNPYKNRHGVHSEYPHLTEDQLSGRATIQTCRQTVHLATTLWCYLLNCASFRIVVSYKMMVNSQFLFTSNIHI